MQRTRFIESESPNLLITGDWHLREDVPECRTDNFWEAQWHKVEFIVELALRYDIPIIHSGDLYDHWKPSPYLLAETIKRLTPVSGRFYTIYGNHDLPQHNLELSVKCGINVLMEAKIIQVLNGIHWGENLQKNYITKTNLGLPVLSDKIDRKILVWHVMTYTGKPLWPGMVDPKADILLRKYSQYDLIITGHNHQSFVSKLDERILINPGSITRQTASQIDFLPCVYLWTASTNSVSRVYLPVEEDVVSREHIERKEQHSNRIEAFVTKLNTEWEGEVSFEENLEHLMIENQVRQSVKEIVYRSLE